MGIRTNNELGGTIGGDTTGTETTQEGVRKRGLDVKAVAFEDLVESIHDTNLNDIPDIELAKISELKCINETLKKIEFHLSILTGEC